MGEVNGICARAADASPAVVHVIDDEEEVCWGLETLLASADFQVETHASGLEFLKALATIAEDKIGCVLTDVQMPGMDGLELLHHLKARGFAPPVIVMTAHGDVVMAVRAMKAGATDFIEKPFSDDVLFAAVRNALAVSANSGRNGAEGRRRAAEAAERIAALSPREREV